MEGGEVSALVCDGCGLTADHPTHRYACAVGRREAAEDFPRCPLHGVPLDYDENRAPEHDEWFCPEPGCGHEKPDLAP